MDFPLGLGIQKVVQVKNAFLGWRHLWYYSPEDLAGLIRKLREEYVRNKDQRTSNK